MHSLDEELGLRRWLRHLAKISLRSRRSDWIAQNNRIDVI